MSQTRVRIRRIEFSNFKALENFTLTINDVNVLVGPNNSGKSTLIGALRTLDSAMRVARSRAPARVFVGDESYIGYRIPEDSIPISLENVQTNYNGIESRITFRLDNGNHIALIFPHDGGCVLVPTVDGSIVASAAIFKKEFPISLVIVPVLGPVEHREQRRERNTVVSGLATHKASRHFRSYWHYYPAGFDVFADLISKTWPGMNIGAPEYDQSTGELSMFCLEDRMTRELYWVGFGFQIWCQLLTHLSRASDSSLVVVDEPEVYLHPDVQRQLLGIIRDIGADVLMATHSSEIIAEADPSEIIIIDKRRQKGERLKNILGVQRALDLVGSSQNITLTALAKSRRVLFVEGLNDFRMIRRFARRAGMQELSTGLGITPLASGGFGSWQRITILASGIAEALGSPLMIGAVYDRDYFCDEHIAHVVETLSSSLVLSRVLKRKEIENYLLLPAALDRAVARNFGSRKDKGEGNCIAAADVKSASILSEITAPMKGDVLAQIMARRHEFLKNNGDDSSVTYKSTLSWFDAKWESAEERIHPVCGKEVLKAYRDQVQERYGVTLTDARIFDSINRDDIPADMSDLLRQLDEFRQLAH